MVAQALMHYYCCLKPAAGGQRVFFKKRKNQWTACPSAWGPFPHDAGLPTLAVAKQCARSANLRDHREPGDKIQVWVEDVEYEYRLVWQDPPLHPLELLALEAGTDEGGKDAK